MASRKKRYIIILLSILGIILILVTIFFTKINTLIEMYTRAKLSSLIEQDPNSIYDIKYDSLILDIYSGDIEVINFSVSPKKQIIDSMRKHNIARKFVIDFKMGDFMLDNLEIIDFLMTGNIELDGLLFDDVNGKVYVNDTLDVKNSTTVSDDILSNSFISAFLHDVHLKNGSFQWFKTHDDTVKALSFENFNVNIEDFYSDSTMMKKARGVELTELNFSLENFENRLIKDYTLTSEGISFDSEKNIYSVSYPKMIPSDEKVATQNYLSLHIKQVDIAGINYDSLIHKNILLLKKVHISSPKFTYIRPPQKIQKDTLRELPATTFKKIPVPLVIDTLIIDHGVFDYLKHGYGEPLVKFDIHRINIQGYNFASNPDLMGADKTFMVGGNVMFFNETPVKMDFTFPITDPYNSYDIVGTIDTLPAENLNPIIKNSFKIRAISGTFNKMEFNIHGNDTVAKGNFNVDYNNLKLESLKIDEKDFTHVKRKGFNTFLVNTLAKKKNDPAKSSFTKGIIYLDRDDHLTFLDFNLNALLSGLVTSVIPEAKGFMVPKEERKAIKQDQKVEKKEQRKEQREEQNVKKKEQRIEKKEQKKSQEEGTSAEEGSDIS
jgi:hypothetical protein